MNPANQPVAVSAVALAPPPPPPQPHRLTTSCDRHPDECFTGFCPACLCERLAVLEQKNDNPSSSSSSRKPPLAAAALKALFKPSQSANTVVSSSNFDCGSVNSQRTRPGFFPELRRAKSFSASKNEGFPGAFEPQRRSCDVRVRNTLSSLFSEDDERNPYKKAASKTASCEIHAEGRDSGVKNPVFESEEGKAETESACEDKVGAFDKVCDFVEIVNEPNSVIDRVPEIVEEEEEEKVRQVQVEEFQKPMKHDIDCNPQTKKPNRDFKEIAGSFLSAASVFSKKLQKWRQKQKLKKHRNAKLPVEKPIGRQFRDTQSEIADYGFGRRSCDTDPRFSLDAGRFSLDAGRISLDAGRISLDAGRISVDDPRYSFDEPRASWDGYLMGRMNVPPRMPSMLSAVEDSPVRHHVPRTDTHIPVEEPPQAVNDENAPGGSAQTREYYLDSSSRRRKSLDRSNSIRKAAASVVAEIDELKSVSNSKVSPLQDRAYKDAHSLRDDCSVETFEMGFRDNASVISNGEKKGTKKSRRWTWNIFGLIHKRSMNKQGEEEDERISCRGGNGVERSFSESWNGEMHRGFDPRMLRSNSSTSWRSSTSFGGSSLRKSNVDSYNIGSSNNGKKRDNGFVLERNRSARYSPNKTDNGLLRFYLAPMRGSRRGEWGKSRPNPPQPISRTVTRLY